MDLAGAVAFWDEGRGCTGSGEEDDEGDHLADLMEHEGLAVEAEGEPFGAVEDDGVAELGGREGGRG